jgi:ribulose-phosphate 3-epimerase
MCSRPEILLEPFVSAGANQLNIHVELGEAVTGLLWKIRSLGCRVGLAVNPSTPVSTLRPFLDRVDAVLIMTVNPGFGGQPFIHETLPKIEQVAEWRRQGGLNFRIGVDGGVDFKTASECAHAGADTFISGTTLFASRNLGSAVRKMRKQIQAGLAESSRPGSVGMQSEPITA